MSNMTVLLKTDKGLRRLDAETAAALNGLTTVHREMAKVRLAKASEAYNHAIYAGEVSATNPDGSKHQCVIFFDPPVLANDVKRNTLETTLGGILKSICWKSKGGEMLDV